MSGFLRTPSVRRWREGKGGGLHSRSPSSPENNDNRSRLWGSSNANTHIALLTATFYVPEREESFSTFGARRHEAQRLAQVR